MDGPDLVRRVAAGVLAVAVSGWLSTLSYGAGGGLTASASTGPAPKAGKRPAAGSGAAKPSAPVRAPLPVDCARAKCVALTFDDGPTESTATLLDILAARRVRATFFLIGQNAAEHPELVRREVEAGHEIANHSYTHADLGRASEEKVMSELTRTQEAVQRASGVTPVLLRPPYGSTSRRLTSITRRMNMAQILWTVDPLDWAVRNSRSVERRVMKAAAPGNVVLMHDIHPTTVAAVPRIIDRLAARGFVFVTVTELFGGRLTPGKKYVQR
ncbi:polysaccharide deacetylase family protein [Actinomadura rubrisoli]|uniref:Polysaccharide deacetylase family protein n=1 Tax=Actinomadura rubrisoli TaxID=2530368 RepID=A0A4R4ZZ22_9ACTN|nr:polysaccharide deacetylase family protein [Actinomadura rubrisoli]TDD64583.1 polysaccharide deacetylase family protein [Actinomadura rubrisoli]